MELFFEICRHKTHIMVDVRESSSVADIKAIVAGIMQRSLDDITLKRPKNDQQTEWEEIHEEQTLLVLGYTQKTAKPDDPVILAFLFPEDHNKVSLNSLSTPPPLPDAMQSNEINVD